MRNRTVWMKECTKDDLFKRGRNIVPRRTLTKIEKKNTEKHLHLLKKIVRDKETRKNK